MEVLQELKRRVESKGIRLRERLELLELLGSEAGADRIVELLERASDQMELAAKQLSKETMGR